MPRLLSVALAAVIGTAGSQAHAAWYKADSTHFVIYADQRPQDLKAFASKLERFDQAVRYIRGMGDPPVGTGNRLTVFVMPTAGAVQKLIGDKFIDGFYVGRASGSLAFVARMSGFDDSSGYNTDLIFFHEYAHHLMFQAIDRPLPEWVVEGFAEFMSTTRFDKNGDIGIGAPANHRAWGLFEGDRLPLETLLSGTYTKITDEQRESIYGRGWLLVHYLTFEKSRGGQLDRYADLLSKGVPSLGAARAAFGDLKQLDRDLNGYLNRSTLTYLKLSGNRFVAGNITVTPLTEGASKVVLLRAQSKSGVTEKTAEPLAAQVRAIEARYPGDEFVELTLSEAELDSDHAEAALAAADRALKANPKNTKAMILKGRATEVLGAKQVGEARRTAFERARALFIGANKLDTEDPEPLMEFYKTFYTEGVPPTTNAIAALHYASELAPQDEGLRLNSAMQFLAEKKPVDARRALIPIAYDPHGGDFAQMAKTMITKIDAGDIPGALAATQAKSATGDQASSH